MATEKPKPPTSTDAKDAAATKNETKEKKDVAALEEDDQFEDFPASGKNLVLISRFYILFITRYTNVCTIII